MPDLKSFDRVAHCYDATRGMPPDVTAAIADAVAGALRTVCSNPLLLEVGIGTGRIAVPLAERGVRITGIDIAPKMLALLRGKRSDIDVILAEAARPPLRYASFDAAIFVHILHLVPDAEATIRATLPLIRPRGIIIRGQEERDPESLDERMADILQRTARETIGIELEGRERHQRGLDEFERVVAEAGCKVETVEVAKWARPSTARHILNGLAEKNFSGAWQIPDAALQPLLEAITPTVVAYFGGMDVERPAERSFTLAVARLP